jgi:cell filamentation protein
VDRKTIRATQRYSVSDELKDPEQFAKHAAGPVNEMNAAHPFLEGSGRTIRVWLQLFARDCDHRLDFTEVSKERWYTASTIGLTLATAVR